MKYNLVVYKSGMNPIHIVDLKKISEYENLDDTSLFDIIKFTNEFTNEEDLMEMLLYHGMIPKNYSNGSIGINYYKNKNSFPKLLKYGVSYKEDSKFFDLEYLKKYYIKKLNDKKFLKPFLKRYYTYLKNVKIFSEFLNYINFTYETLLNNNFLIGSDREYSEECMEKFITFYTRRKDHDGNYKTNIAGLRDLAMFAINYDRKTNRKQNNNRFKDPLYLEKLKNQLSHYSNLLNGDILNKEEYDNCLRQIHNIEEEIMLISNYDKLGDRNEITRN